MSSVTRSAGGISTDESMNECIENNMNHMNHMKNNKNNNNNNNSNSNSSIGSGGMRLPSASTASTLVAPSPPPRDPSSKQNLLCSASASAAETEYGNFTPQTSTRRGGGPPPPLPPTPNSHGIHRMRSKSTDGVQHLNTHTLNSGDHQNPQLNYNLSSNTDESYLNFQYTPSPVHAADSKSVQSMPNHDNHYDQQPPLDVYALPIRKRSISTHSAGGQERGLSGLLEDLAKLDQVRSQFLYNSKLVQLKTCTSQYLYNSIPVLVNTCTTQFLY